MYTPAAFADTDPEGILQFLREVAFGHLVNHSDQGDAMPSLVATALPFVVDDELTTIRAHVAKANGHWRLLDGSAAMLIVPGFDGYVSPRWYPSKAEHGKVVPTWNYELAHVYGTVQAVDDAGWLRSMLDSLTTQNEHVVSDVDGAAPWATSDAPADYIAKQLTAIVGLELTITSIQMKRKMSQNRTEADRASALTNLSGLRR